MGIGTAVLVVVAAAVVRAVGTAAGTEVVAVEVRPYPAGVVAVVSVAAADMAAPAVDTEAVAAFVAQALAEP